MKSAVSHPSTLNGCGLTITAALATIGSLDARSAWIHRRANGASIADGAIKTDDPV